MKCLIIINNYSWRECLKPCNENHFFFFHVFVKGQNLLHRLSKKGDRDFKILLQKIVVSLKLPCKHYIVTYHRFICVCMHPCI